MKFFSMMSLTLSILFMNWYHPMLLTIITVAQSLIVCLMILSMVKNSWMSYVLFLIFLGGMMILFVYICSLASNELFMKKINFSLLGFTVVMILMISSTMKKIMLGMEMKYKMMFMKMFNKMTSSLTLILMIYLLLVLIIVVKNMLLHLGPLRTKKNI